MPSFFWNLYYPCEHPYPHTDHVMSGVSEADTWEEASPEVSRKMKKRNIPEFTFDRFYVDQGGRRYHYSKHLRRWV